MTVKHFARELEPVQESFDAVADVAPAATATAERLARTATRLARTVDTPLSRVRIQQGDTVVELEWPQARAAAAQAPPPAAVLPLGSDPTPAGTAAAHAPDDRRCHITAPMVGNFYHAPEPGAAPFVQVGDVVEEGQHIGVVEAMKLMNPIQAEQSGRVVEVLVGNGHPVEYDQPLIALEPLDSHGLADMEAVACNEPA